MFILMLFISGYVTRKSTEDGWNMSMLNSNRQLGKERESLIGNKGIGVVIFSLILEVGTSCYKRLNMWYLF